MKHIEYRAPIQTIYVLLYLHIQKRCTELIDPRRLHKIRFVPIVSLQMSRLKLQIEHWWVQYLLGGNVV